jgi:hypothetical protein
MAGYLLDQSAVVLCMHRGRAEPLVSNPRVKVLGQQTVQQVNPWIISGCSFSTGAGPQACTTAEWTSAALRVKSSGQPLLLQDSQAICTPNGTGVNITMTQTRVTAQ